MTRRTWTILLLATGCAGVSSEAPRISTPSPGAPPVEAPVAETKLASSKLLTSEDAPYAALFEPSREWPIALTGRSEQWDSDAGRNVTEELARPARCWVAEVGHEPWGDWSRIDCDGLASMAGPDVFSGVWVVTQDGLWREDAVPGNARTLEASTRLLTLPLVPSDTTSTDPSEPRYSTQITVSESAGIWCHTINVTSADESWRDVCIERGRGFVSGSWGWAGGSSHEAEATVVR